MSARTLRSLCDDKAFKFGHFVVEFATPGIGHILKGAGCEFVLFDTEHSGFSTDVVRSCVRYFEAAELPAIFRVPSKSYDHLARYADMGAEGIMVPLVNDAREAKELVVLRQVLPRRQPRRRRRPGARQLHGRAGAGEARGVSMRATACSCRSRRRRAPRMPTRSRP